MRVVFLIVLSGCSFAAEVPAPGAPAGPDASMPPQPPTSCDLDNDGLCDDQTWRCGTTPDSPGGDPIFGDPLSEAVWSHDVSLANKGRFVVATGAKPVALRMSYDWRVDCAGPALNCQAQVEVGLVAAGVDLRFGCLVDRQMPDRLIQWAQDGTAMLTVPAVSGIYDVRLEIAKGPACDTAWQTPGGSHTIAKICVP